MSRSAIECVARALSKFDGYPADRSFDGGQMWESYLPAARVVVEALHEPSRSMISAGKRTAKGFIDVGSVWRAMIEAAEI